MKVSTCLEGGARGAAPPSFAGKIGVDRRRRPGNGVPKSGEEGGSIGCVRRSEEGLGLF